MHATSSEGEPLGHLPHGTGRVTVLTAGGHGDRAGHSTLGNPRPRRTTSQTYPLCSPPAADCAGSQGLLPYGQICPRSYEDLSPWGRVPARLDGLPEAQLWVPPGPAVPGWPLCYPCPVLLPVPARSHGSMSPPNCPLSTAVPSCLAPSTLSTEASLGLWDRNGQLLCPGAGVHWGFCVLFLPGPWSPWVERVG